MSNIINRLRDESNNDSEFLTCNELKDVLREAADHVEAQDKRIAHSANGSQFCSMCGDALAHIAAQDGQIGVLKDLLNDALMPLIVARMDAMTSGEDDDFRMLGELITRIKSAKNGVE